MEEAFFLIGSLGYHIFDTENCSKLEFCRWRCQLFRDSSDYNYKLSGYGYVSSEIISGYMWRSGKATNAKTISKKSALPLMECLHPFLFSLAWWFDWKIRHKSILTNWLLQRQHSIFFFCSCSIKPTRTLQIEYFHNTLTFKVGR